MAFWRIANIEERWVRWKGGSAADWLFVCAREGGGEDFKKIMCGVWLLWNGRNATRHGNKGWEIDEMGAKLGSMIYQGEVYLGRNLYNRIPNILFLESDKERTCIFCDGSWKVSGGEVGLAAVVKERGEIVAVVFEWCAGRIKGGEVEGEALCLGMRMAEQLSCKEAVIISDSLDAVNLALLGCDRKRGGVAWLTEYKRLQGLRMGWEVKHAMREDNELADRMARFALDTRSSWLNPWAMPRSLAVVLS